MNINLKLNAEDCESVKRIYPISGCRWARPWAEVGLAREASTVWVMVGVFSSFKYKLTDSKRVSLVETKSSKFLNRCSEVAGTDFIQSFIKLISMLLLGVKPSHYVCKE